MHRYKTQTSRAKHEGEETGILAANVKETWVCPWRASVMWANVTGHLTKSWVLSTILVHLCAADVVVRGSDDPWLYLKLFIWQVFRMTDSSILCFMVSKCDAVSWHFHYTNFYISWWMTVRKLPRYKICQFWVLFIINSDTFGVRAWTEPWLFKNSVS